MRTTIQRILPLLLVCSCNTTPAVDDYQRFYERQPRDVLVLPVTNETTSAEAPSAFQSTIASPLIRRGYYVFPVLPTIQIMRAEGIYHGEQLSNVSPEAFSDILGADAVLRITIHQWDTVYMLLASGVTVSMSYELIDTTTGEVLWQEQSTQTVQSGSSGSLIADAINAAATAMATQYVDLARQANATALASLPAGPLHETYEDERARYLEREAGDD